MSKYITHFQTESAYQAALPTIELPNVSLVDELGEVHYHSALYGAHAGDIALYDVAEAQKIVVTAENWNLTTYPTASYPIIGVVVADESVTYGVKVMATHPCNADGTAASSETKLKWQNANFDWGLTKYATTDAGTDFNGKTNTAAIIAAIKAYDIANNTDNITGNLSQGIQAFAPTGTVAGEWYIPAGGEFKMYTTNKSTVNATLQKIRTANSSLAVSINGNAYFTSTENINNFVIFSYPEGGFSQTTKNGTSIYHRPFYQLA